MDVSKLLSLCRIYSGLGWSVHEQLEQFMDGADMDDLNPNALMMIQQFFETATRYGAESDAADQAEYIKDYLAGRK